MIFSIKLAPTNQSPGRTLAQPSRATVDLRTSANLRSMVAAQSPVLLPPGMSNRQGKGSKRRKIFSNAWPSGFEVHSGTARDSKSAAAVGPIQPLQSGLSRGGRPVRDKACSSCSCDDQRGLPMTKITSLTRDILLGLLVAVPGIAFVQPAQAAQTDPEVIIYRFPGIRDDGGTSFTGIATVFHCTTAQRRSSGSSRCAGSQMRRC